MLNSRNINDLRPDVAANCRMLIELCRRQGLLVGINQTVRDQEFQDDAIRRGAAPVGSVPTFHAVGVGLAFDIHQNIAGREWELPFFGQVAEIAKRMGFAWGGDWRNPDRPHFQWDNGGRIQYADILAGRLPPPMPPFQETPAEEPAAPEQPSAWAFEAWDWAMKAGITDGTRPGASCTREQVVTMLHRLAKHQGGTAT